MANPQGFDPKTAQNQLDYLQRTLPSEDWKKLQEAKTLFRSSVQKFIDYAEKNNFDVIMLGNNLEEENSYSDNCQEFIRKFGELIPNSVNLNKKIEIAEPVGNLMKHEIVKLGLEINAPLHLSWSCYEGKEVRCGTCGPCNLRKKAFAMNDRLDLVPYSDSKII